MKILVQKFGGTSLDSPEKRNMVVDRIENAKKLGYFPIIVVSAIGRCGDPYSTDTLVNFARSVGADPNPRELDLIMSCGEIISCVILSNTLKKKGYESKVFSGGQAGIITDENFGDAEIKKVDTSMLTKCIKENLIPIVAGFQGISESGSITTLGRGGSDVTALVIAEALNAEMVEVYTNVDGVMTADPSIVPDAKVIDTMFYNEVFQMAEYGAKVIHPRAVEVAMRSNIPLMIKNTLNKTHGTLITSYDKSRRYINKGKDRIINAIAQIANRTQFKVIFDGSAGSNERDDILFKAIAENGISVDMINIFPEVKIFIVDESQDEKLENRLKLLKYNLEVTRNCTKVTIIGNKMQGIPGVISKLVEALNESGIDILQTSDSHTTISCLLKSEFANTAINNLHKGFSL